MMQNFISVEAAKFLVALHCKPLSPVEMPLAECLEKTLTQNIYSPIDVPGFDQSAMDGYALLFADVEAEKLMPINGESFAGITEIFTLIKKNAARIFTGAPLPSGADTVVMQEHTAKNGDGILIEPGKLTKGIHVRKKGSEIKKDALALEKGTLLTPGAIGFLASLGISSVMVNAFPKVSIIVTGKELVKPGAKLLAGQAYDSNSLTLTAALQKINITDVSIQQADDDVHAMTEIIKRALEESDLILITGGVSVGDYDFVLPALEKCEVEPIFHKVKQRPGKPLFFGKKEDKIVFGLPGNPSSVLSCFYNYVLLAIQQMIGRKKFFIQTIQLPIKDNFTKAAGLTHFLKGYYYNNEVSHLQAQESYRLSSFALANCLIEIPENAESISSGELVTVHLLH